MAPRRGSVPRRRPAQARSSTTPRGCPGSSAVGRARAAARSAATRSPLGAADEPLVIDAERGPRPRAQALRCDLAAAALALPVRPGVELRDRAVDLLESLLRALLEPLVQLAVEGDGRHVAEVVVA